MSRLQLPPKRFQPVDDPKYDPIRRHEWFASLTRRRDKLGKLKQALLLWNEGNMSRDKAADAFGIRHGDLEDYSKFAFGNPQSLTPQEYRTYQAILDEAYSLYVQAGAKRSIRCCIRTVAPRYGRDPKPIRDLWDIDSTFYPTGYEP